MAMLTLVTDHQDFSLSGPAAAKLRSRSFFECTLVAGTETMQITVQTCTTVRELKEVLAAQMGYLDPDYLEFVVKQGISYRRLYDVEQVLHKMNVRGIASFKPPREKYRHPYAIIGAGYLGIKTALTLVNLGSTSDYMMFDRFDRVGGHTWLEMANKTTRLQTEFPTYAVWYGHETSKPDKTICRGAPIDHELWPSRDNVLAHFQLAVEGYGILPHIHFRTNVSNMDVMGKVTDRDRYYELLLDPVLYERRDSQGGGALDHQLGGKSDGLKDLGMGSVGKRDGTRDSYKIPVSTVAMWPGALVFPRPVSYRGEESFEGPIDYAVEMRFDYSLVLGKVVCIVGHGAFTMENIRTCLENRAKFMYVLCRKPNLMCPRPASWFVNQSNPPISAAQMLDMLRPIYLKHVKIGSEPIDPWDFHSVFANASRTHATIMQKTRFGIGDVYFLSQAYGLLKIVVGEVKRCTQHTLHLENGGKLECEVVLKCTGCIGDWKVDKIMKIKEMRGNLVNGDFRRACSGEPAGINATQFTATSHGPGYYSLIKQVVHFWDQPNDWSRLVDQGILENLPCHRAGEPDEEFPAYLFTSVHAQGTGIVLSSMSPLLGQKESGDSEYKNYIQHLCAPPGRLIADARADWEQYEEKIRRWGLVPADAPYVPYLYTLSDMEEQQQVHKEHVQKGYAR